MIGTASLTEALAPFGRDALDERPAHRAGRGDHRPARRAAHGCSGGAGRLPDRNAQHRGPAPAVRYGDVAQRRAGRVVVLRQEAPVGPALADAPRRPGAGPPGLHRQHALAARDRGPSQRHRRPPSRRAAAADGVPDRRVRGRPGRAVDGERRPGAGVLADGAVRAGGVPARAAVGAAAGPSGAAVPSARGNRDAGHRSALLHQRARA